MSAINLLLTTIGAVAIWPLAFAALMFLVIVLSLSIEKGVDSLAALAGEIKNEHRGAGNARHGSEMIGADGMETDE